MPFREEVAIGNPKGLIALFMDKEDAINLMDMLNPFDKLRDEIRDAIKQAYPEAQNVE